MKLKCIGGFADGQIVDLPHYYKVGDLHRVYDREATSAAVMFDPKVLEIETVYYLVYRVTVFCFDRDDTYKFLVPYNWTDKEAIMFQFAK